MTPTQAGVIGFAVCVAIIAVLLPALYKLEGRDHWYNEGWCDCEDAHHKYEMTPDDELVLKELKKAMWEYIKMKELQKNGDKKRLSESKDFADFRQYVWEVCVWRKEKK